MSFVAATVSTHRVPKLAISIIVPSGDICKNRPSSPPVNTSLPFVAIESTTPLCALIIFGVSSDLKNLTVPSPNPATTASGIVTAPVTGAFISNSLPLPSSSVSSGSK